MATPTPPAAEPTGTPPAVPTPAEVFAPAQTPPAPSSGQPASPTAPAAPAAGTDNQPETDWESEATKWKAIARQHENRHVAALGFKSKDDLTAVQEAAQKWAELQDSQKSEIQRATEQAQTMQQQLEQERAQNARLMAAATHGVPPELIELLGNGTPEEINSRAEMLAARIKATAPPAPQRPVESLTPGAAPASNPGDATPDQWIRSLAGRSTT